MAEPTEPQSRFYQIVHRIADGLDPEVQAAFLAAMEEVRDQIDIDALQVAIEVGDTAAIEAALGAGAVEAALRASEIEGLLARAFAAVAQASDEVMQAFGIEASFAARDARAIIYARTQAGTLITRISDDQLDAVRQILARAQVDGIPPKQQARYIHQVVGLRADHAAAPLNLAEELRAGQAAAATSRRLDAATKAEISARIAADTVDDAFVDEVVEKYTHSLRRRRAEDIARTETLDASHQGLEESWDDAQRTGALSTDARKVPLVTPDDRLRETHAAIPAMNPEGRPLNEPFQTPFGERMRPPFEPLCRCGMGLIPNPAEAGLI